MLKRSVDAAMASVNAFVIANTSIIDILKMTAHTGVHAPVSGDDIAKYKARQREKNGKTHA